MTTTQKNTICIFIMILLGSFNASSQLDLVLSEDEFIAFDYVPNDYQNKMLLVTNNADSTVLFNWEFIISDSSQLFIEPQFNDLNLSYFPEITTNCDVSFPNTLTGQATGNLGINIQFSDLIATENEVNNMSVMINLLSHPDCNETLASIEIPFKYFITSNDNIQVDRFSVYPNPSSSQIILDLEFSENSQYSITNLNGKIFDESLLISPQLSIDHLPQGTYIISVESQNRKWNARFIKLN